MEIPEFSPLFWALIGVGALIFILIFQMMENNALLGQLKKLGEEQEMQIRDLNRQIQLVQDKMDIWERVWEDENLPKTDLGDPFP